MERFAKINKNEKPQRSSWSRGPKADEKGEVFEPFSLGRSLRHHRLRVKMTLAEVGAAVETAPSVLSLVENGKREPKVSLLQKLAGVYGVTVDELMSATPDRRASLEIELERAMRSPLGSGLPKVRLGPSLPMDALESLVALHRELKKQADQRVATPEEARRANTGLRAQMRAINNYFPELEVEAKQLLDRVGYRRGPLPEHTIGEIVDYLGFTLNHVSDLPHSTRSLIDLKNRRVYLSATPGRVGGGQRAILLQTLAHHVLGHEVPHDYAEFLRQRIAANYLAAALLIPEERAVTTLQQAKTERDLAVEDLRDGFAVSYEAAAHRMTNLLTHHLGIHVHFQKVHESGLIYKAYENDGVNFPTDHTGAVEGQPVCRHWTSRQVFSVADKFNAFAGYTDTPNGTFWCTARVEGEFSLSIGVPFEEAKWFRGRETKHHSVSRCPDPTCCRLPPPELQREWAGFAWPNANARAHLLAALPPGAFPGVDETDVYEFLAARDR